MKSTIPMPLTHTNVASRNVGKIKMSTADCKNLLVDWFTHLPGGILGFEGYDYTAIGSEEDKQHSALKIARQAKHWKRERKITPKDPDFGQSSLIGATCFTVTMLDAQGKIVTVEKPLIDIAVERHFICCEDKLDTGLRYSVLEDHQGNLFIGEYLGD